MRQRNNLDYNAQTNRYNFTTIHPINLKLLSLCSAYSAETFFEPFKEELVWDVDKRLWVIS